MIRADIVTVFHNTTNFEQHLAMFADIREHEPKGGYRLIGVDNRTTNRGFAAACNLGAFHPDATAPMIAFLNPDVLVNGPFLATARAALAAGAVITGCRFGKADHELQNWGVRDWVCGATLFVDRRWFTAVGGFDTQFVWAFEETDLIRRAEAQGKTCRSISLPLRHASPARDTTDDATYKRYHFGQSQKRFYAKWRGR